ncbi:hypothetical protein, partial [Acidilobus sp.]|uniref:hypothetical protein n=1 Tax=Acidilobus sp. TaxID=1872109 RepID=UPI003D05951C
MSCGVDQRFLLKAKIFALLHDPAWKPWVVGGALMERSKIVEELIQSDAEVKNMIASYGGYEKSNETHEAEAYTVAKVVADLKDKELEKAKEIVKWADVFSSSLDRYLSL